MSATRRVIVVGSGIAGLTAARHAARHPGTRVTVITKGPLGDGSTRWAQGGIAGVLTTDDRIADHARDTLAAGAWLGDPAAIDVLVGEGPTRILELAELGVPFDRDASGAFIRGLEAAHSAARILHAGGDATGLAIQQTLDRALEGIQVLEHACLVDLVRHGDRVVGVEALVGGRRQLLEAEAVVLATGGLGELYAHSTNPRVATGDGLAAAMRAGAAVADLEFVQFHPTVLAGQPFLVSEAVRGEGALLLDEAGRRFALEEHPDGELAPRDVLARAIARRMAEQDGRPVLLDATGLGRAFLASRFPTIDRAVRERGLDWSRAPIPVTPAAHYAMGGIVTDLHGRTSLPGLYAGGEVARTGVHGANRLASNSLLEGAVFGARAGEAAALDEIRRNARPQEESEANVLRSETSPALECSDAAPFTREALQELMWRDAGVLRSGTGLARATAQLAAWRTAARTPATAREHEDRNLLEVAIAVVAAASARTQSIGAHHRVDAPTAPTTAADHLELAR